mgnify:CR=1 FL=1
MGKQHKKAIRAAFRGAVFARDRHTCQVCGRRWTAQDADPSLKRINAHHITDRNLMPGGGYVLENGITVCDVAAFDDPGESCHMRVEAWHISGGTQVEPGLHPDKLYERIGSSQALAIRKSERLERG